ncbi:hypothetical protein COCON_G00054220 [Conger conger]|uniref:Myb/SANT-like DNA-binding domain-containing protein n=1 Tax=Conger conger TaxID=82655 RepID=A0A9Q1DW80_CONCO|nr:hypothetical protein COCON_G00054220 [Conger conger]
MTGTGKAKAWKEVTDAVNVASVDNRTISEVKRKWFDMKLEAKKRICPQKKHQPQEEEAHRHKYHLLTSASLALLGRPLCQELYLTETPTCLHWRQHQTQMLASAPPMMWLHHLLPPLLLLLHPGIEAEEVIRLSLRMRS